MKTTDLVARNRGAPHRSTRWRFLAVIVFALTSNSVVEARCVPQEIDDDDRYGPIVRVTRLRPNSSLEVRRQVRALSAIREVLTALADAKAAAAAGFALERSFEDDASLYVPYAPMRDGELLPVMGPVTLRRPSMLVYAKRPANAPLKLIGARYIVRGGANEADLDQLLPLSAARWQSVERRCSVAGYPDWVSDVFPFEKRAASIWRLPNVPRIWERYGLS